MMVKAVSEQDWAAVVRYDPSTGQFVWLARPEDNKYLKAFNVRFAGKIAGHVGNNGYSIIRCNGRQYLAHRIAWFMYYGDEPRYGIDHINGVRTDNRIANLRDVPQDLNLKNQRLSDKNKSGCSGVYFSRRDGVWHAQIYHGGKPIYLGHSVEFDEAVALRKKAESELGYHPNHGRAA